MYFLRSALMDEVCWEYLALLGMWVIFSFAYIGILTLFALLCAKYLEIVLSNIWFFITYPFVWLQRILGFENDNDKTDNGQ